MVNFNHGHVARDEDPVPAHHASPVVAFIIGLAIILLASIMNAAGLNLTKLDHVRTSAIPKSARRRDWLRPLWLLGMILYILSQLIGSTLALDYMRAEYVAPLGSTSLVFNFLFARFLVGTPVTNTDIYGTIIVVLGVIGIVAFGGINSGLSAETDVDHLTTLWRRGGWLGFFFAMSIALILVLVFTYSLDAVLAARSDIEAEPFAGMSIRRPSNSTTYVGKVKAYWDSFILWVKQYLEIWTGPKDDKQIAWTLGIGWACCGGGLAGGCLVFAKATVSLLTGSLSHENPGNQFGHAAPIFTIILLAVTAVLQIICLNRGLKVYDSTLVVPVFYGVYTASGFLNSMVFNNQIDAYKPWVLVLIFISIGILISGVVLLTYKKPEPIKSGPKEPSPASVSSKKREVIQRSTDDDDEDHGEQHALTRRDGEEGTEVWQLGDVSDDEDEATATGPGFPHTSTPNENATEGSRLIHDDYEASSRRESTSSDGMETTQNQFRDDELEEFGEWNSGGNQARELH